MSSQRAAAIFRRGSRTYFYSSLFFPPRVRRDVATLYAFVRTADDFVDRVPQDAAGFEAFAARYARAQEGEVTGDRVVDAFAELARRCRFEPAWVGAFLASMRQDLTKRRYATLAELKTYMHGSAEVVGLMMARIMGLAPEAEQAAARLGRAMQYINFLRDVGADRQLGRTYLPQEVLAEHGLADLGPATVASRPEAFRALLRAELARYRRWQAEAEAGFDFLPWPFRLPIETASRMYLWTADQIERRPEVVMERVVKPAVARILAAGFVTACRLAGRRLLARSAVQPLAERTSGQDEGLLSGASTYAERLPVSAPSDVPSPAQGASTFTSDSATTRVLPTWRRAWLKTLIQVSRPRFWLYLGGTYLVGYTAGASSLEAFRQLSFWLHLLFFLGPANVFLYGLNDLADADTDQYNPKKGTREHLLATEERSKLMASVAVSLLWGLGLLAFASWTTSLLLVAFLVLSAAYSLPPLRFKARSGLDSASNVLYALPGFLGYVQSAGLMPPPLAVIGAASWTAAMHLLSAVPDIGADRAAGIATTATVLGSRAALLLCAALWAVAFASLLRLVPDHPVAWLGAVYPLVALLLVVRPDDTGRVYWVFPYLNAAAGFLLFAFAVLRLVAL